MRHLCFFNSTDFWGGGEKHHLEYAVEMQKRSYKVVVACRENGPLWQRSVSAGLTVFPINVRNNSFLNPVKLNKLVRFYREYAIDTVIFSTSEDVKLGSIAANIAGVQQIVYLRVLAVPIRASALNRFIFKRLLTHVVANSQETKRNVLKHLGKYVEDSDVKVIYPGIQTDPSRIDEVSTLPEIVNNRNSLVIGNAGRLTQQKGQHLLVEVAKILKDRNVDFKLYIAGDGEMKQTLEEQIQEYQLGEHVILLGFVKNIEAFMNSIDIFALSSLWEGFGFVIAEAMIKGKPVVAFDLSSNNELIDDGETGYLVDYPDLEMFANKIMQLTGQPQLRESMGVKSKERIARLFSFDKGTESFEKLLNLNGSL